MLPHFPHLHPHFLPLLLLKSHISTLSQLQRSIKSSPNYLKQNPEQAMSLLINTVRNRKWKQLITVFNQVELKDINQWRLWSMLAQAVNSVSEAHQEKAAEREELEDMLAFMGRIRYEPYSKQNPRLFATVKGIMAKDLSSVPMFASHLLVTSPDLFEEHRQLLQTRILKLVGRTGKLSQPYSQQIFTQGTISKFWGQPFTQKLYELLSNPSKYISMFFQLPTPKLTEPPTKRYTSIPSITQQKLWLMLADIGYNFQTSMSIDGTEVDMYFGSSKLIVQYNGMFHYRINSGNRIYFRHYNMWRNQCLRNKGFVVVEIPFYEWDNIKGGEKAQKLYMISKIEKFLLRANLEI